jgi:hypothetical protein
MSWYKSALNSEETPKGRVGPYYHGTIATPEELKDGLKVNHRYNSIYFTPDIGEAIEFANMQFEDLYHKRKDAVLFWVPSFDDPSMPRRYIVKAYITVNNCFNYSNEDHIKRIYPYIPGDYRSGSNDLDGVVVIPSDIELDDLSDDDRYIFFKTEILKGDYALLEDLIPAIKKAGFDSYLTDEADAIAVFNPNQINIVNINEIPS